MGRRKELNFVNLLISLVMFSMINIPVLSWAKRNRDATTIKKKIEIATTINIPLYNERAKDINGLEDSVVEFRIIKSKRFLGCVFPKNIGLDFPPSANRYSASNYDIELAEQLISKNMPLIRNLLSNRRTEYKLKYPYYLSYRYLRNYYRRYIGYKNKKGELLVRVFFEKMPLDEISLEHVPMIYDGIGYTWFDITVNITNNNIFLTPFNINSL